MALYRLVIPAIALAWSAWPSGAQGQPKLTQPHEAATLSPGPASESMRFLFDSRCIATAQEDSREPPALAVHADAALASTIVQSACPRSPVIRDILFHGRVFGDSAAPKWGGRIYGTRFDAPALARIGIDIVLERPPNGRNLAEYTVECTSVGPLVERWIVRSAPEPDWNTWTQTTLTDWGWDQAGNFPAGTYTINCSLAGQILSRQFIVESPPTQRVWVAPGHYLTGMTFYGNRDVEFDDPEFELLMPWRNGFVTGFHHQYANMIGIVLHLERDIGSAPTPLTARCARDFSGSTQPEFRDWIPASSLPNAQIGVIPEGAYMTAMGAAGWGMGNWPTGTITVGCEIGGGAMRRDFMVEIP